MSRRVKAGSYWRTMRIDGNIVEVIKLLENGWSNQPVLAVRPADPKQLQNHIILDQPQYPWYRCKKNGEWFKGCQSKAQIQARAMWQLKGAFQMFLKALEEAEKLLPPSAPSAEFARTYFTACIKGMDNHRKKELADKLELRKGPGSDTKEQAK